jgi:peptidoglycan/xylan/chitin deacetylase (PgdA/CDA1 family)
MRLDPLIARVGRRTPRRALRPLLRAALRGLEVALCLHRVSERRRPGDRQPALTIPPGELDALVELLAASEPKRSRWLTLTFDDGYADAASYVETRAPRFPSVDWIFFVCPEKTEHQVGFRWDLAHETASLPDPRTENRSPELKELGRRLDLALASVEACRRMAALPNVSLGNHTNCHFRQTTLSPEQARTEYEASQLDFERLFGPQRHFAFPYGTPDHDFGSAHVELLRAHGPSFLWSTERRPFSPAERIPGAVLPRFPVDGTWGHRELALWIAARALVFRGRGTRHLYPMGLSAPGAA